MKKFFIIVLILFISAFFFVISAGMALWYLWSSNLPYIGSLKDYNPPIITEIFSDDGQVIYKFFDEKRVLVSLDITYLYFWVLKVLNQEGIVQMSSPL